jgi:hypothetical protein
MLLTKNPIFDVVGTGRIGLLLVTVAVFLAIEMKALLLGESATPGQEPDAPDRRGCTAGVAGACLTYDHRMPSPQEVRLHL